MACGTELSFLSDVEAESDSANSRGNGEDLTSVLIGKMQWLIGTGGGGCDFVTSLRKDSISSDEWDDFRPNDPENPHSPGSSTNTRMKELYGGDCRDNIITSATRVDNDDPHKATVTLHFAVVGKCLRTQLNFALSHMQEGNKQLGSSGLPCNGNPLDPTNGEWDVTVRDLIRITFLNNNQDIGKPLDDSTVSHIRNDLITVDSKLGDPDYFWAQCGDTEHSTGSAEDRADENSWIQEALQSVGDILTWLFRRLILILIVLTAAGVVASLVAALSTVGAGVAAAALVAVAGILTAFTIRIPESENHRLNIESSRYLNNQMILAETQSSDLTSDQAGVKEFLMNKCKEILRRDFIEYNALPYQRYSLEALMNLADFSQDNDVKLAAAMALEYSFAKFALGSNQGRRLPPFRRLMDEVKCIMGPCARDGNQTHRPKEELELFQGSDYPTALGLLYTGQTQQLLFGNVSTFSTGDMVFAASSRFRPDELILDLAIRKDIPYFQRIHHAGFEIYSSAQSFIITAGGIETDFAYQAQAGPFQLGGRDKDRGAAVPTTVMLTRGQDAVDRTSSRMMAPIFLRVEGQLKSYGDLETFEDNLCVWKGFACGANIRVPSQLEKCLVPNPPWYFLDSTTCLETNGYPPFYIVLYRLCGSPPCQPDDSNAGFVEIVNAPVIPFLVFIGLVQNNNGGLALSPPCLINGACNGHYQTMGDSAPHDIEFNFLGHQADANRSGIESIDGQKEKNIGEWQFAEGDVIQASGDGIVKISNNRLSRSIQLDLHDTSHPARR
jgi:hypothetical protein